MQSVINWKNPKESLPTMDSNVLIVLRCGDSKEIAISRYLGHWADPTFEPEWFNAEDVLLWAYQEDVDYYVTC